MASITIRKLEDFLKARLRVRVRVRAAQQEEDARPIPRTVLTEECQPAAPSGESIRRRFAPFGGIDLPDPDREPLREPPEFG